MCERNRNTIPSCSESSGESFGSIVTFLTFWKSRVYTQTENSRSPNIPPIVIPATAAPNTPYYAEANINAQRRSTDFLAILIFVSTEN